MFYSKVLVMILVDKTEKEKNKKLTNNFDNKNSDFYNLSKKVVVIGGANIDIKGKSFEKLEGITSNPGKVSIALGGVGRNIAHNLTLLEYLLLF